MTQILPLAPEDIPEKAAVHAQTWQETYRGLLPDELNDTITPQFAEDVTRRLTSLRTLVAKIDGSARREEREPRGSSVGRATKR